MFQSRQQTSTDLTSQQEALGCKVCATESTMLVKNYAAIQECVGGRTDAFVERLSMYVRST